MWKENLKRDIESLWIIQQIYAIGTKYMKTKIDKLHHNSKCRLYEDKDEMIIPIIKECNKLVQKNYKTWWEKWSTDNWARD